MTIIGCPLIMVPYDFELLEKKGGFYMTTMILPCSIVSDYSQFFDEILNILNGMTHTNYNVCHYVT